MGVYFSTDICFGIAGDMPEHQNDDRGLPAPLDEIDLNDDDHDGGDKGNVYAWLQANGYPDIRFDYGGDMMSGPGRWCFYVAGTLDHYDREDYQQIRRLLNDGKITLEATLQIERLREALDHEHPPAWLILTNVS